MMCSIKYYVINNTPNPLCLEFDRAFESPYLSFYISTHVCMSGQMCPHNSSTQIMCSMKYYVMCIVYHEVVYTGITLYVCPYTRPNA
jgi:hypothetical protein